MTASTDWTGSKKINKYKRGHRKNLDKRYFWKQLKGNRDEKSSSFRTDLVVLYIKKYITSSVYDCTVEDVEYIYNTLSLHTQQQKYCHILNLL